MTLADLGIVIAVIMLVAALAYICTPPVVSCSKCGAPSDVELGDQPMCMACWRKEMEARNSQ